MNTPKKEIDIIDLLTALHTGRWLIIGGTLAICVLGWWPQLPLAKGIRGHRAKFCPPAMRSRASAFPGLLSSLPIPALRLGEKGTPSDISLATIRSTTTRRRMVEKFGLMQRYEARTLTDAMKPSPTKLRPT